MLGNTLPFFVQIIFLRLIFLKSEWSIKSGHNIYHYFHLLHFTMIFLYIHIHPSSLRSTVLVYFILTDNSFKAPSSLGTKRKASEMEGIIENQEGTSP